MKSAIWKILIILVIIKAVIIMTGTAMEPYLPDFMDRYSAYPQQLYIEVNIPEGAVYLYQIFNERQFLLKKYPCSVGTMEYKTPEGNFLASEFTWNPGWTPPKSKWAEKMDPIEPGGRSPLGCGSLMVDWEEAILIHGTLQEDMIGKPASHGCIRLRNEHVRELLTYIQDHVPNSLGKADLATYRANPSTSYKVYLNKPVAVKLVYRRCEKDGARVNLYPDVYTRTSDRATLCDPKEALAPANGNMQHIAADLAVVMPDQLTEKISMSPYPYTGSAKPKIKKYYASAQLRLFVWTINKFGESHLLDKYAGQS